MSQPETARELLNQEGMPDYRGARRAELARRVERVLALHCADVQPGAAPENACWACGQEYPCSTIRALDGQQ